jgi:hypothetical protein
MASDLVKQDAVFRWVSSVNRIKCSSNAVGLCPVNGNSLFQRHTRYLSFLSMHVSLTRSASIFSIMRMLRNYSVEFIHPIEPTEEFPHICTVRDDRNVTCVCLRKKIQH